MATVEPRLDALQAGACYSVRWVDLLDYFSDTDIGGERMRSLDWLACLGLALGAALGLAGSFVAEAGLRGVLWGIDGAGIVMAASLLTVRYSKLGKEIVAAGFLVFAVGEGVILSGAAAALNASAPSFAAGTALWGTGLLLISVPKEFPIPVRLLGIASAVLFLAVSLQILAGVPLTPLSQPLPVFAYPVFVLTIAGWIWTLLRAE